jgi:hypothetical protein
VIRSFQARLAALAAVLALVAPQAPAQEPDGNEDVEEPETVAASPAAKPEEPPAREAVPLIRALRDTRAKPPPPPEPTVELLAGSGAPAIPHLVDILVAGRLPALDLSERVQTLSVPQREMILEALSRSGPGLALKDVEARLVVDGATVPERIAALYVLACAGDSTRLHRAIELALAPEETELTGPMDDAFRCAFERILRRDPRAYSSLTRELETARPELHVAALGAIGTARSPESIETLTRMMSLRRDLADAILAQVHLVGRSRDLVLNRELASAAAEHLDPSRPELCSMAARAIGELNDSENVAALIELLEAPSVPVRESALWGLRRISRLELSENRKLWERWHQGELAFWRKYAPSYFSQLQRGSRATKMKAVNELGKRSLFRDETALAIADVLLEPDPVLRTTACQALAGLGSPMAFPRLADALEDSEEAVRAAAHAALQKITGKAIPNESELCRKQLGIGL